MEICPKLRGARRIWQNKSLSFTEQRWSLHYKMSQYLALTFFKSGEFLTEFVYIWIEISQYWVLRCFFWRSTVVQILEILWAQMDLGSSDLESALFLMSFPSWRLCVCVCVCVTHRCRFHVWRRGWTPPYTHSYSSPWCSHRARSHTAPDGGTHSHLHTHYHTITHTTTQINMWAHPHMHTDTQMYMNVGYMSGQGHTFSHWKETSVAASHQKNITSRFVEKKKH